MMKDLNNRILISVAFLAGVLVLASFSTKKSRVLIVGDSISIGYFPLVKETFKNEAEIIHNPGNAQNTTVGLANIHQWIGKEKWDVIQFNWGLWDLCRRSDTSSLYGKRDKLSGVPDNNIDDYAKKLEELVVLLKQTNAKLIFVTTTAVPEDEPGRVAEDVERYNNIARSIMKKHQVFITELYEPSIDIHKHYGNGRSDVHYTKNGYEKLASHISAELKKYLQ
jgi:hypothetical protein